MKKSSSKKSRSSLSRRFSKSSKKKPVKKAKDSLSRRASKRKSLPRKASSRKINGRLDKELVRKMHESTADFVDLCLDIASNHPHGAARVEKHVKDIIDNMTKLNKICKKKTR